MDCICGAHFRGCSHCIQILCYFNCVLEARQELKVNGKFVNCKLAGHIPNVMRVCLVAAFHQTPSSRSSESVIGTYISDWMLTDNIMMEPLAKGLHKWLLASRASLGTSPSPIMPVHVMNSEDIIVCAQTIGLAHEVSDVIVLDTDEHNRHTAIRSCHIHANTHTDSSV